MSVPYGSPPLPPPPTGELVIASQLRRGFPIYKRPWVIAVSLIAAIAIIGGLGSRESTEMDASGDLDSSVLMPDFAGVSLDIALSNLAALGVNEADREVLGLQTLEDFVGSNWYVCQQKPKPSLELSAPYSLTVDKNCPRIPANTVETKTDSASTSDPADTSRASESDSPIIFSASAQRDLVDIRKDLDDLVSAIQDNSVFRLLSNVAEIDFNIGQLQSTDPPLGIADSWNEALNELESSVGTLSTLVSGDGTSKQIRGQIESVKVSIKELERIVEQL
jgi:hypothetical protein